MRGEIEHQGHDQGDGRHQGRRYADEDRPIVVVGMEAGTAIDWQRIGQSGRTGGRTQGRAGSHVGRRIGGMPRRGGLLGDGDRLHGRLPRRGGTEVAVRAMGRLNTMRSLGLPVPIVTSLALAGRPFAVVVARRAGIVVDVLVVCLFVVIGSELGGVGCVAIVAVVAVAIVAVTLVAVTIVAVAAMPVGVTIGPMVAALAILVGLARGVVIVVLVLRVLAIGVLRVVGLVPRVFFVLIVSIVLAGRVVRTDLVVITLVRMVTVPGLARHGFSLLEIDVAYCCQKWDLRKERFVYA